MADKLNIDISKIDKNSSIFKKFLNSRGQAPPITHMEQVKIQTQTPSNPDTIHEQQPTNKYQQQYNQISYSYPQPNHQYQQQTHQEQNFETKRLTYQSINQFKQCETFGRQPRQRNRNTYQNRDERQLSLKKQPIITYQRGILTQEYEKNSNQYKQQGFNYGKRQASQQNNFKASKWQTYEPQQFKKKYQKLQIQYDELKASTMEQNKTRKKEVLQYQQKAQAIKQRLFQIQTHEDQLIIENNKLKQKLQQQALIKIKLQQQNKELNYKIQQMSDMLEGKQNAIKKKIDEILYWKNQNDALRQQVHTLNLTSQKLAEHCNLIQSEQGVLKKEKQNKQYIVDDLRDKISTLIAENSLIKDQLYTLTTKLYHLEQQNQALRADNKRQRQSFPQSYFEEQINQPIIRHQRTERIASHYVEPSSAKKQDHNNSMIQQGHGRQRRRGQFAQQRAVTKNTDNRAHNIHQQPVRQTNKTGTVLRIKQLNQELEKIRDMKAMSGALRRRKIQLQRQIETLQADLKHD